MSTRVAQPQNSSLDATSQPRLALRHFFSSIKAGGLRYPDRQRLHNGLLDPTFQHGMKRSFNVVEEVGEDWGSKTATPFTTQPILPNKKRTVEELAEIKDPENDLPSRTSVPGSSLEPALGLINMSVIHGPGNAALEHEAFSQVFPYAPLDTEKLEIRVVVLRAGTESSPIRCDLEHVSTKKDSQKTKKSSRQSYKALSYTWGSPDIYKTISLNDVEVQVRENLWQALYHLRASDADGRLWIDAICINQDDIPERNRQVSRMGTIYGMADEVLIWLGPEQDDSKMALEFIEKTMSSGKHKLPPDEVKSLVEQLISATPVKHAISKLVERDYWKRVWIIQEVFRARKIVIHCGTSVLPWPLLAKFFRTLDEEYPLYGEAPPLQISLLKRSIPANLTWHRTSQTHNLETLLETYRRSLCSDPRDRVYSLLGLANRKLTSATVGCGHGENEWIVVDYTKSPLELFNVLSRLMMCVSEVEFSSTDRGNSMDARIRRLQLLHEVLALKLSCLETVPKDPRVAAMRIECSAFDDDTVFSVIPSWGCTPDENQRDIEWYRKGDSGFRFGSGFSINDLEPIMNSLTEDDLARVRKFQHMDFAYTHRSIDNSSYGVPYSFPIVPSSHQADEATSTRRNELQFLTTRGGHLGIGSKDVAPGDVIYMFRRSDVAIAVRFTQEVPRTTARVIGRVLLLKSDREVAFEAGSPMADFQYYVPSRQGSHCFIALPLAEWQSLTW